MMMKMMSLFLSSSVLIYCLPSGGSYSTVYYTTGLYHNQGLILRINMPTSCRESGRGHHPPPPPSSPTMSSAVQYIIPGMVVVVVYTTHTFLTPHSNISPPPLTCKGSVSRECVISLLSLKLKIINRNVQYSAIANIFEYVSKVV